MIYITLFLHGVLAASLVPFPSEASFLVALDNGEPYLLCLLAVGFGNTTGSLLTYLLARVLPVDHKWMRRLGTGSKHWKRVEAWSQKNGNYVSFFCWVPFVGDLIALALGVFRTNIAGYTLIMGIGKFFRFTLISMAYWP